MHQERRWRSSTMSPTVEMIEKKEKKEENNSQPQKKGAPWWIWGIMVLAILWILGGQLASKLHRPPTPLPPGVQVIPLQGNAAFAQLTPGVKYYLETRGYMGNLNVTVPVTLTAVNPQMQPLSRPVPLSPTDYRVQLDDHKHFGFWPRWIEVTTQVSGGSISFYR